MFNARLGVELFLKGMIMLRDPSAKFNTHALEELAKKFLDLYPEHDFQWNIPFTAQTIGGTEQERDDAVKKQLVCGH